MLMYRNKRRIIQSIRSYYNDDGYIRILLIPTSSLPYILVVCTGGMSRFPLRIFLHQSLSTDRSAVPHN